MGRYPSMPIPTLAQRAVELRALPLDGARVTLHAGCLLRYRFSISPSNFGRIYECELRVTPDARAPEILVLRSDLTILANKASLPHIYPNKGPGTKLCLWWPKKREWLPQMKLTETYIPWASEWLWYFEDWLTTGVWAGGGRHPEQRKKRWN